MQSSSQIITTNKSTPIILQARWPSCRPTNQQCQSTQGKVIAYIFQTSCRTTWLHITVFAFGDLIRLCWPQKGCEASKTLKHLAVLIPIGFQSDCWWSWKTGWLLNNNLSKYYAQLNCIVSHSGWFCNQPFMFACSEWRWHVVILQSSSPGWISQTHKDNKGESCELLHGHLCSWSLFTSILRVSVECAIWRRKCHQVIM